MVRGEGGERGGALVAVGEGGRRVGVRYKANSDMLERRGGVVDKFHASSRGFETLRDSFRTIAVMIRRGAFEFSKPCEKN